MTEDFKDLTLKYVTNNIVKESDNANQFRDNQIVTNNLVQELTDAIGRQPTTYKMLTTTTTSNYLVYGEYRINDEQPYVYYGYIAVLNENGIVQHVFTTYDSGTKLSPSMELSYDENGNIYGVDFVEKSLKDRIILLNNVALESSTGYHCRLRSSYYINYNIALHYNVYEGTCSIKKVPGEAIYYIFGQTEGQNAKELLIKFINNVGMPNEWYSYEGASLGTYWIYGYDSIIEKSGDTQIIDIYYDIPSSSSDHLKHIRFNGESLSTVADYTLPNGAPIMDLQMATKDKVYITSRHNNNDSTYNMYLFLLNSSYFYTIDNTKITMSALGYYLNYQNGIIFGKVSGVVSGAYKVMCIAYDGNVSKSPIYEFDGNDYLTTGCEVQNTFSLYKFIVQSSSLCSHPSIVIYSDYSGSAKEDYNSVSAGRGELYSDGYIMFARPLYNKQVIGSKTISTLEIPNSYLNGIAIDEKNLLSYSNNELVSDTTEISKNIYEQLFINFTNSLSVIDEDTETLYPNVANYINQNINVGTEENCLDTNIGIVRINYENSQFFQSIFWTYSTNHYETSFMIDANAEIPTSIDFMSKDGSFSYLTKELDIETNGYYVISQKLRIE